MSYGMNKTSSDKHYLSKNKPTTSDSIVQLDGRLQRLADTILPRQPYLLSVPSDVPYRHSSRFVNTWYEGTPFDRSEEQLQYISFLSHQGEDESLLKVEGSWADDSGNRIDEDALSPKTVPNTGQNTPAYQTQRKKITLKDYKTKGKTSPEISSQPQTAPSSNKILSEPAKATAALRETLKDTAEKLTPKQPEQKNETTKPIADPKPPAPPPTPVSQSSPNHALPSRPDSPSPAKRRRLSPPFEERKTTPMPTKVEAQPAGLKMPRLLSPTLPSPEKQMGLPDLLSPLLPPSLAKAISTPPDSVSIGSPATGSHSRTDPVRAILAGAELDNSPTTKGSLAPPSSGRVRSDSQHSVREPAPSTPNITRLAIGSKALAKIGSKLGTPVQNGARASPGPRQRHTIILKYGKKNRKRVEALLKFASRPKKTLVKTEAPATSRLPESKPRKEASKADPVEIEPAKQKPSKEHVKEEAEEVRRETENRPKPSAPDSSKSEKKRRLEETPALATKRLKPSGEVEKRPSTPVPAAAKTPLINQSKSTFSTPKKEFKSTAMRRVESTETLDVPTPTGERGRVSTPVAGTVPKPSTTTLTTTTSREEERSQWTGMNTKFFALGRTLKHAGTKLGPSPNKDILDYSGKSVTLLIEALLCFMINISAQAHARPGVDPGWTNIIPYHIFVWRASRKHPALHGLVVQLGAVCRQLIHKCDMDRLARDPLPDDYCNSAPTPGSDGNTKTNEDAEKYKKAYIDFKDNLIQNARELQTAWLDGSRHLPPDVLKRDFPNTWMKRAKDSSLRLQEKLTPSKIPTDFYLPLDANTTAFEAARFGLALLEEWTTKEKVEWKTSIEL